MPETTDYALNTLPSIVGVMQSRELPGANNLSDDRSALIVRPLSEALSSPWQSDAHFVTYCLINIEEEEHAAYPRCNKPILGKIRKQGLELLHKCMVVDIDTEDHTPWDRPWLDEILANLTDALTQGSVAGRWTSWYTTTNGMRLVYELTEWIRPEDYEAKHRWLCRELIRYNVPADLKCSDWTRIFRLPFVVRDGEPTWEAEHFDAGETDRVVSPDDIKELGTAGDFSEDAFDHVEPVSLPMPSYDDCFKLMFEESKHGRPVQSMPFKKFKSQIKNRELDEALQSADPIAPEGRRDSTLHQLIGQAIGLCFDIKGFCPELLMGILWEKLDELAPDQGTPSWHHCAWSHICRIWAKEAAKAKFREVEEVRQREQDESLVQQMLDGMREWCKAEDLHADDAIALAYLNQHLICSHLKSYSLLGPDGRYGEGSYGAEQLVPRIRTSHLNGIIDTFAVGPTGQVSDRGATNILNAHSFPVQEAQAIVNAQGGTIKNIDSEHAVLNHPLFELNADLLAQAEFNPLVNEWLVLMFGDNFEKACFWVGWALDFASGATVAALSLVGAPGAGKKMFVQGLAECLRKPALATHEDITTGYGYGLLKSPFLVVNEGWPQSQNRGQAPSDQMKAMIGGDAHTVQRRYMAPVTVMCPTRIIMTANDFEVVSMLGRGKELTRETTEALAVRLFNVQLDKKASDWLRGMGGSQFTEGWIAGDNGEASKYVVAKHFMWLYQNRGDRDNPLISPQRRLVVEGNMDDEDLSFMLRTQSGSAPLVIETIVMMLEGRGRRGYGFVVHENEGRAYVLASAVLNYYRQHLQDQAKEILTESQIAQVLTNISINENKYAYILRGGENMGPRRWHELDLFVLNRSCERSGMRNAKIRDLLATQRGPVEESLQEDLTSKTDTVTVPSVGQIKLHLKIKD